MNDHEIDLLSRRRFLRRNALGIGLVGLSQMLTGESFAGIHAPGKAKAVIQIFLNGGMSQVDTFDPKPALEKYHGQRPPGAERKTERQTVLNTHHKM